MAGNINVGKNFILQSDGDVTLVNQKINVGENFVVDANNFIVRAGENTYKNDTKSSSTGGSVGYDIVNQNVIGGLNISGGNSNTSSKYFDNSVINVGGTFQLTTKEDALFAGVNVTADKINFDIGRDLSIISLQDEYTSDGKNWGAGLNVSGKLEGTQYQTGSSRPSLGGNYGENHQDSKWVNNQTTIIAENGGNIKVGETLTNIGAVIGGAYPVIIDYDELFEKKVVINKKSFKVYNYSILKNEKPKLQYEKKIEEDDYNEIKKIAYETITNSWSEGCSIRNDGYHRPGGDEKLRFIYSKLEVEGVYICLYGSTEILQYLNNKYNLNIEWSKKVIFY